MFRLRYITGGESHGEAILAIVEGLPAGVKIDFEEIVRTMEERMRGYGRGGRMKIEGDEVEFLSGIRFGKTTGGPISIMIRNRDYPNWKETMSVKGRGEGVEPVTEPRPGHADLAGAMKFHLKDIRPVMERASARDTAVRCAVGAVVRSFLKEFGIRSISFVLEIAGVKVRDEVLKEFGIGKDDRFKRERLEEFESLIEKSKIRTPDIEAERSMIEEIDRARMDGDTVGGIFEVRVFGLPPGLGSFTEWDERLDGCVAKAVMSIPGIKGVEIGLGFESAKRRGSKTHDEIFFDEKKREVLWGYFRKTNRAGGMEGGVTNGEDLVIRAVMKPIPTLGNPLHTVDLASKKSVMARRERADICAVPAAGIVAEAVVLIEVADALLIKFGGDTVEEVRHNLNQYLDTLKNW